MINKILDDLIQEAREYPDWKAVSALHCAKKELLKEIDFCGKWISVKDRPPEAQSLDDDNWVLVWFGEGSELKTKMPLVGRYDAIYGTWTVLGMSENTQSRLTISHWMPLPKLPKEG